MLNIIHKNEGLATKKPAFNISPIVRTFVRDYFWIISPCSSIIKGSLQLLDGIVFGLIE